MISSKRHRNDHRCGPASDVAAQYSRAEEPRDFLTSEDWDHGLRLRRCHRSRLRLAGQENSPRYRRRQLPYELERALHLCKQSVPITTVLSNNNALGMVYQWQRSSSITDASPTLGPTARRITSSWQRLLEPKACTAKPGKNCAMLRSCRQQPGPMVIECILSCEERCFP